MMVTKRETWPRMKVKVYIHNGEGQDEVWVTLYVNQKGKYLTKIVNLLSFRLEVIKNLSLATFALT